MISELQKKGAKIRACDPVAIPEAKRILKEVEFFEDPYKALKGAEALILVTEWEDYKNLDFVKIKTLMKYPIVIDGRNVYNKRKLEKFGFLYEGVGK